MIDLLKIAKNLKKEEDGIYHSKTSSNISYPDEGNSDCFQIEENSFWFTHRNNVIKKAVLKYSPQKLFFDIGGGNGFVSKGLQDEGLEVVLVEPGYDGALNAKKRNIKNIVCSTLEDSQFQKSSLASIGMFDVVEHIDDDLGFLKNVYDYLEDDGNVYITVPAFNFLWSNEDDIAGHFRRYSLSQLEEVLTSCGFSITYSTYVFSILPFPVFLFRSIPSRIGLNKNPGKLSKQQREHNTDKNFFNAILNRLWRWELKKIENSKKIPFGGSCFVVAKK
ncbi:class I SAM-dependent methyltransferase [Aquimarina sp. 2304DJ70-9]|uniref:class I SAM-dependent methyltransferase n=1 Tax=Aquimarina penaris TaxID=3231044 RepID=UPI003462A10A